MNTLIRYSFYLTISAVLLLTACGKDNPAGGDPPPPPQEDPMKVGTSGGSLSNSDSTVTLDIPQGSLSSDVTFTIEETTAHPGNAVGTVYDIGPDGTQFDPPVTLTLKYDEADLPSGAQEPELVLTTVENNAWSHLTTTVNEQDNTVSAEIEHLSVYGIMWNRQDPSTVGSEGGTVTSEDQNVTLEIPAGAISNDVTFSIEITTSHPAGNKGTAYEIGPSGTVFADSATLTITYDGSILNADENEADLKLATVENNEWVSLTSSVDVEMNTVSAKIKHLSVFGIILKPAGAAGWSAPQQISGSGVTPFVMYIDDLENPEVAFDGNGNALAVWRQNSPEELWWSRYDAAGDVWTAPSAIVGSAGARTISLAMNDNGEAIVAWHSFNSTIKDNELYASIYAPSFGWSSADRVDASNGSQPDAAIDANGQATVTWNSVKQDPDNSSLKRTKTVSVNQFTPGSGWDVPIVLEDHDFSETFSRVTVGTAETAPNGEAYVTWTSYDGVDTYWISMALISDTGLQGSEILSSTTNFIAAFPELAIDGNGNAIIAWGQNTSGSYRELRAVEYDRSADLFGNPVVVDNILTGTHNAFSLSSAGDGTSMLVWRGFDGVYNSVYASLFTPGSGWGSAELVENFNKDEGTPWDGDKFRPKVTVLSDGTFLASWHFRGEESTAAAYANSYTISRGWGTPQLVQDYWADGMVEYAVWPYPAAGPNGEALLIWAQGEDNRPSDVWISRFTSSN